MHTEVIDEYSGIPLGVRAPRRLGQYFQPKRNLYALYLPLLMMAMSLVCWVVETDLMLVVGSVVLAVVSGYLLFDILVRRAPLRISTLFVATLGLGYGLGAANTWFTVPRSDLTLGAYLHHDPAVLTHGIGSVLFSMSILLAVGELVERPIFGEEFVLEFPPQSVVFISVGVLLLLVAYATHALDYMGAQVGNGGQLGLFPSFAEWLIGTLLAISLVAALNAPTRALRRYLMFLTGVQFLLQIPIGRRSLIYTVILAVIALRLGRFRFQWNWTKRILVSVVMVGVLYVSTVAFFYLRLAGFSSGKQNLSIGERVVLAITMYETTNYAEISKSFSENVHTRTFILGFLAEVESLSYQYTPGYGADLKQQALAAVPSVLFPGKDRNAGEEGLANELFGTAYWDEANSLLTAGAIDFGLLGMIVYPLLIAFLLRLLLEFIGEALPTFVATFITIGTIGRVLEPENMVTDYFIIIRNGLLFGAVVWFFIALPAFKLRDSR